MTEPVNAFDAAMQGREWRAAGFKPWVTGASEVASQLCPRRVDGDGFTGVFSRSTEPYSKDSNLEPAERGSTPLISSSQNSKREAVWTGSRMPRDTHNPAVTSREQAEAECSPGPALNFAWSLCPGPHQRRVRLSSCPCHSPPYSSSSTTRGSKQRGQYKSEPLYHSPGAGAERLRGKGPMESRLTGKLDVYEKDYSAGHCEAVKSSPQKQMKLASQHSSVFSSICLLSIDQPSRASVCLTSATSSSGSGNYLLLSAAY
ncbi:hypothetical protein F7725_022831 [Dissostichus mawsoni]|uniref:Uncharacterized protein n=1 Tax=Dissostichus mawsoni TaxID=36200 RepID=A0A7J5YZC4_DISMA|nr:hypothetical protein F7725_022831 [Dissostichus mawsoni]